MYMETVHYNHTCSEEYIVNSKYLLNLIHTHQNCMTTN